MIHAYAVPLGICMAAAVALIAAWLVLRQSRAPAKHVALGSALAVVVAVAFGLVYQARTAYLAVTDGQLIASAAFVRLQLPLSSVSWQDATDASDITLPNRRLGTSTGGVELGKFRMHGGRHVFVLRTDRSSLLVRARGDTDLVLDRRLYDQLKACLDQMHETRGHQGKHE
ncbi:hypothetical protein [Stenotrophomonas rhizophila]|uniref:hypothetical protein n=1 Tax=Stenotrophomonas rhizophila TaxID=216778 RepID=UPI00186A0DCE|nr:hypothetical protein [Stenotrophomonas rhizophila]